MPEALISLPDSNLAVESRFTGSKIKKAGDSSGSTETNKQETQSFSEVRRSLNNQAGEAKPAIKNEETEEKQKETSDQSSMSMAGMTLPFVHPEPEAVPILENAVSEGEAAKVEMSNPEVPAAYTFEKTPVMTESGKKDQGLQTFTTSEEQVVYEEMDSISIASRSFSESVSDTKNSPAKTLSAKPQETTTDSTGNNKSNPLDELFLKNTGEPETIREPEKIRERITPLEVEVSLNKGEKSSVDSSEESVSLKANIVRNDFSPFKGEFPEDIMEKNILGNFKMREFLNSIKEKFSTGDSSSTLKINAEFQKGDSSDSFKLNINTSKEMLKIKTQGEVGSPVREGFVNLMESQSGDKMRKIPASYLNENAMTEKVISTPQTQISSVEIKDDNIPVAVSKERFTEFFVSKVREFFPGSIDGKKTLKLIITPPDLGEVRVTMEMKKSVLHTGFQCTPEAAKAINTQIQNLSRSLSNMGIQLGSSNIDTGQHNTNPQNHNHSQGYNSTPQSEADLFPLQTSVEEDIITENSKVLNVLI